MTLKVSDWKSESDLDIFAMSLLPLLYMVDYPWWHPLDTFSFKWRFNDDIQLRFVQFDVWDIQGAPVRPLSEILWCKLNHHVGAISLYVWCIRPSDDAVKMQLCDKSDQNYLD